MRKPSFAGASGDGDQAVMMQPVSVRCSNRLPLVALFSCIGMGLFGCACAFPVQIKGRREDWFCCPVGVPIGAPRGVGVFAPSRCPSR